MTFNWLDGIIAIILVINTLYGLRRGLIRTLFGMLGLFIALLLCLKGTPAIAELLLWLRLSGTAAYAAALILLFIIIYFLVNEIGRHIQALLKDSGFKPIDQLGGSLCGLLKGIIYTLFLLIPLLGNIFASPALLKAFEDSALLNFGHPLVYYAEPIIQKLLDQGSQTWQEYRLEFEQHNTLDPVREGYDSFGKPAAALQALPQAIGYY
ncbi:MAG: CvpA family protein [Candidatus Margulisbacteria bacterium]|jgi:membrane protein required for colicin V production|nr:CvpA family protein [Candidatus Margulisiibacteriota bacterium]